MKMMNPSTSSFAGVALALAIPTLYLLSQRRQKRGHVPNERVLILGASSGVGQAIARRYAQRGDGVRICVVARRADKIQVLAAECGGERCLGIVADATVVEDMVRVRDEIASAWGGLDTIHVCAGVSALQPIMALTGTNDAQDDAAVQGIQNAVDITGKAVQGNLIGPLIAAVTFVSPRLMPLQSPCRGTYSPTKTTP